MLCDERKDLEKTTEHVRRIFGDSLHVGEGFLIVREFSKRKIQETTKPVGSMTEFPDGKFVNRREFRELTFEEQRDRGKKNTRRPSANIRIRTLSGYER